jgi:hypothetical protein
MGEFTTKQLETIHAFIAGSHRNAVEESDP